MDKSRYQQFLHRVKREREELQEDLINLPLNASTSKYKVGDFGCGWGYITWCLMHEIPNSECVGIDKFDPADPPILANEEFSFDRVRSLFIEIGADQSPDFRKGDIVKGENLSSGFDLIYCKRVLFNIFKGNNGDAELKQAINHIANALKSDGWFCLVEIQEAQFKDILEKSLAQANFELDPPRCVCRLYKTPLKDYEQYPYLIYQCKKGKY